MVHWEEVLIGTDLMLKCMAPQADDPLIQDFFGAFALVWRSMPDVCREAVVEHWKKYRTQHRPGFLLEDPWDGEPEALATTEELGSFVKYDWATLKHFHAEVMVFPIAHEMAHVYQFSIGKHRMNLDPNDLRGSIRSADYNSVGFLGRVELHADEIMLDWGFQPTHGIAWLHQHFRIKGGKAERRSRPLTKKYSRAKASAIRWRGYHR